MNGEMTKAEQSPQPFPTVATKVSQHKTYPNQSRDMHNIDVHKLTPASNLEEYHNQFKGINDKKYDQFGPIKEELILENDSNYYNSEKKIGKNTRSNSTIREDISKKKSSSESKKQGGGDNFDDDFEDLDEPIEDFDYMPTTNLKKDAKKTNNFGSDSGSTSMFPGLGKNSPKSPKKGPIGGGLFDKKPTLADTKKKSDFGSGFDDFDLLDDF